MRSELVTTLAPHHRNHDDLSGAPPDGWLATIATLGARFAERVAAHDQDDAFVAENYAELKAARVFSAGIPESLGGGGASYRELCEMVNHLARDCGSTALALSMHYHLVAAMVWRWRHQQAPVEPFLERLAREQLALVSSGGSDWLQSSGQAEPVEGGFRVTAHKVFASGCPAGDLLLTSAVYNDPQAGPTIVHFPVDLTRPEVKLVPTWQTLGMRGTGSHDILIEGLFVPATAVSARRPQGRWHPLMHLVAKVALPLIYSTYVGLAEAARDLAVREALPRRGNSDVQLLVGEMENELFTARLAHARMVAMGEDEPPEPATTNAVLMARTVVGRAAVRTVEQAIEIVGGRSFYRKLGLERLFRDVQAARFHPVQETPQRRYAGRLALELDLDGA